MNFRDHYAQKDKHAFLGASSWHWLNYSQDHLVAKYRAELAKLKGTKLHALAEMCIRMHQKLPNTKKTLSLYVNDAIGYRMSPEVVLYYSDNCFGTADSISFSKNFLRIHDLKTGVTPARMEQLYIYDALFCLEYHVDPYGIKIENRIYQNDQVLVDSPSADLIKSIMTKIVDFDQVISKLQQEEGLL